MLTRRQWLQGSALALTSSLYQAPLWAQEGGSVIAARFGRLPARAGRVFASGPPAGVLLAAHIGVSDMVSLALAWAFVGLRAVRSAVHCTFNHVTLRFVAYVLATLVLIAFWARLAFALAAA